MIGISNLGALSEMTVRAAKPTVKFGSAVAVAPVDTKATEQQLWNNIAETLQKATDIQVEHAPGGYEQPDFQVSFLLNGKPYGLHMRVSSGHNWKPESFRLISKDGTAELSGPNFQRTGIPLEYQNRALSRQELLLTNGDSLHALIRQTLTDLIQPAKDAAARVQQDKVRVQKADQADQAKVLVKIAANPL